jgi:predicted transcriptional regulator
MSITVMSLRSHDITVDEEVKTSQGAWVCSALDLFVLVADAVSVAVLVFMVIAATKALHAFRQSKQALRESASLIGVIVSALSSRVEVSESALGELQSGLDVVSRRSAELEGGQADLRSSYLQLLRYLQEILSNDRTLILELEQLKSRVTSFQQKAATSAQTSPAREGPAMLITEGNILASLTPTEHQTLQILMREGPKAAPELGRRLRKSREHTARLMKKLYLEGYADRESNYAPYRYKLNEKVRLSLESTSKPVTAKAAEMAEKA